jgi:nicotinamide-nucleotide amidase
VNGVIIGVGDERLIGQIVNSNAAFIGRALEEAGVRVLRTAVVGDDAGAITRAFDEALRDATLTICTGGLGPTPDDLTKRTAAEYFGMRLETDPEHSRRIAALLAARGIPWGPAADEQSLVPKGATVIPNPTGTAAGLLFERAGRRLVLLPGVPQEMTRMMTDSVIPVVSSLPGRMAIRHRTIRTSGAGEQTLHGRIGDALPGGADLAYLPSLTGVRLRITARGGSAGEVERAVAEAEAHLVERVGRFIYGEEEEELETVVGRLLAAGSLTLAVAESCTGGLVARKITSVPGASGYFLGGVVAYSNNLKTKLLDVPPNVIERFGAVSEECARAMAAGIRAATGADIGLSVTGIAGPSGGTPEKPVGLVWTAVADGETTRAARHQFGEGRERVTERACTALLLMAWETLMARSG